MAKEAKAVECRMIDAPVSGGVGGASAATLTFMIGGSSDDLEESREVCYPLASFFFQFVMVFHFFNLLWFFQIVNFR